MHTVLQRLVENSGVFFTSVGLKQQFPVGIQTWCPQGNTWSWVFVGSPATSVPFLAESQSTDANGLGCWVAVDQGSRPQATDTLEAPAGNVTVVPHLTEHWCY